MRGDSNTTILELRQAVSDLVASKDWKKVHTTRSLSISIALEAAELMELFQWATDSEASEFERSEEGKEKIAGEMADILIYIICLANYLDTDISAAIRNKIAANFSRFPDKDESHKGETIYNNGNG